MRYNFFEIFNVITEDDKTRGWFQPQIRAIIQQIVWGLFYFQFLWMKLKQINVFSNMHLSKINNKVDDCAIVMCKASNKIFIANIEFK